MNKNLIPVLFWTITSIILLSLFFIPAIHQDISYHNFADSKTIFGLRNFWNVISNFPFVIIGIAGLFACLKSNHTNNKLSFIIFYWGILFTGIGSAYYHFA